MKHKVVKFRCFMSVPMYKAYLVLLRAAREEIEADTWFDERDAKSFLIKAVAGVDAEQRRDMKAVGNE